MIEFSICREMICELAVLEQAFLERKKVFDMAQCINRVTASSIILRNDRRESRGTFIRKAKEIAYSYIKLIKIKSL